MRDDAVRPGMDDVPDPHRPGGELDPTLHLECFSALRDLAAKHGIDVNVGEQRPGMTMPRGLPELAMTCPHGIPMWMEPTSEQIVRWNEQEA